MEGQLLGTPVDLTRMLELRSQCERERSWRIICRAKSQLFDAERERERVIEMFADVIAWI